MISEEVKNAFYEIFEQQEMQIDGEEEEENDNEDNNGDGSDGHLGNSRRDIVVRETTEGEEEETEPQETVEDQSEDINDNKYDDLEEEDNREGSKTTFTFDYLTQLPCQDHPEELNTHYSPILKRLLCPECIIGFQPRRIEHNAKPIRKCHGLILQALDDLISTVEVGRQLADNRVGKLQIKADQMRLTVESIRNRIELKFEEVAEVVEEMKRDVLRKFDSRWEEVFKGVEESAKELETRIERYEEALTEITRIRTKSSKANEELIAFLFGNQTEVEELNEGVKEAKEDHYVEAFDSLSKQINLRLTRSMEVSQMSVFSPLRDYFNDILILNQPKVNLVTRNSKDKSKSPSAKRLTPDKPTVEDSKRPKEIMKEIKSKLEQYKRTRKESSDDQEDDRACQPTYSKQPKQEYNTIPRNYRSGILASREGLNRRNPSEDSYNDQESNDRYDYGNTINTDRHSEYHHTVQDRQLPRYETSSQYYSSKNKDGRKNSFKNYQAYEPYKRDFAKPELGLRSKLFQPDTKNQRGVQSVKHGGYSSSFVGDETAQNRNSNWYFESMKTINDLKNFRDNVRSKLSVATPFSRHPPSKLSTPRYGIH